MSIYKGDVVLNNLRLKPDALAALDLPVTVRAGLLGSLTLKVGLAQPAWAGLGWAGSMGRAWRGLERWLLAMHHPCHSPRLSEQAGQHDSFAR